MGGKCQPLVSCRRVVLWREFVISFREGQVTREGAGGLFQVFYRREREEMPVTGTLSQPREGPRVCPNYLSLPTEQRLCSNQMTMPKGEIVVYRSRRGKYSYVSMPTGQRAC